MDKRNFTMVQFSVVGSCATTVTEHGIINISYPDRVIKIRSIFFDWVYTDTVTKIIYGLSTPARKAKISLAINTNITGSFLGSPITSFTNPANGTVNQGQAILYTPGFIQLDCLEAAGFQVHSYCDSQEANTIDYKVYGVLNIELK